MDKCDIESEIKRALDQYSEIQTVCVLVIHDYKEAKNSVSVFKLPLSLPRKDVPSAIQNWFRHIAGKIDKEYETKKETNSSE